MQEWTGVDDFEGCKDVDLVTNKVEGLQISPDDCKFLFIYLIENRNIWKHTA